MSDLFTRRQVLRGASLAALASLLPPSLRAADLLRTVNSTRHLIMIELEGGNDGLNTIVPWTQTPYARNRPHLKLTEATSSTYDYVQRYIRFSGGSYNFTGSTTGLVGDYSALGIHGALNKLMDVWRAKDMAVVLGLGYPVPNRSHFRGIDIWNTAATDSQPTIPTGWLGRVFSADGLDPASKVNALLFRRPTNTPLTKASVRAVAIDSPADFIANSAYVETKVGSTAPAPTGNPALDLLLKTRFQIKEARGKLVTAVNASSASSTIQAQLNNFPASQTESQLMDQARHAFTCIAGGLNCPFYKLALSGFDNHANQKAKHADLLGELGATIAALRKALMAIGQWDSTLIVTYSEFGRRVEENGSLGTDHGAAAPHFLFGGRVNGGIYGTQPSLALSDLDERYDIRHTRDFRTLFATCTDFLGVSASHRNIALDPFHNPPTTLFSPISGLLNLS